MKKRINYFYLLLFLIPIVTSCEETAEFHTIKFNFLDTKLYSKYIEAHTGFPKELYLDQEFMYNNVCDKDALIEPVYLTAKKGTNLHEFLLSECEAIGDGTNYAKVLNDIMFDVKRYYDSSCYISGVHFYAIVFNDRVITDPNEYSDYNFEVDAQGYFH